MRISDWSSDECSSDLQRGRNGWNEVDQGRYRSCWNPLMSTWTVTGVSPRLSQYQPCDPSNGAVNVRSEEHTSELQSLMRSSYAVFCLKKKNPTLHTSFQYIHLSNSYYYLANISHHHTLT